MKKTQTPLDRLFRSLEYLMAIFLAIMIISMFINIVMRFIFNSGIAASEEVARLAFIFLVYLGTIGAFRSNQHLGVNLIYNKLGHTVGRWVYVLTQLIIIWVMILLAWGAIRLAGVSFNDNWVATGFPRWIVSGMGAVTGVAIIILAMTNIYDAVVRKIPAEQLLEGEMEEDVDLSDFMTEDELEDTIAELSGGQLHAKAQDQIAREGSSNGKAKK
ncbi:TRAP-type C4-dicarboxylate transport system permease small subunit [Trueperella bonasi]|uniref:TRAP-type C4-dicarboxylate transport system permease small subunit n=1 Tax=Trueperella bonasi TaxID=312286 RepID=A0ABT9NFV8_9ACTO|nr:TRAP transporter small permease [Trueperella bonasi]MDP9806085.1 TRAP-type C4-dicarboxylate transport system permease small subunit [Trueperella bonasi]